MKPLHKAGRTCSWLSMPAPRLCRQQGERPARTNLARFHQRSCQSSHFNGVAQRGAGAVHLQRCDAVGADASCRKSLANDFLLARPIGCRQAAAAAILVNGSAR